MARTKHPTRAARELHLALVARAYCTGLTQTAIAAQTGVSQQQISHDLQILQQRWRTDAHVAMDVAKGRELAKIDHLEREAWAAWERSLLPLEEHSASQTEQDGTVVNRTGLRKHARDGSAAFLATIQWCIERRCAIFGLDAPTRIAWHALVDDAAASMAAASGLDKAEVVALAQAFLSEQH